MASVLGMLKATITVPQPVAYPPGLSSSSSAYLRRWGGGGAGGGGVAAPAGLVVECSSRPQKKGTAHHMKTRPKKTQPWDIRRGPTAYPPLPALPPDWNLVAAGSAYEETPSQEEAEVEEVVAVAAA